MKLGSIGTVFYCVLISFLVGCSVKKKILIKPLTTKENLSAISNQLAIHDGKLINPLQEFEARLCHIPIPVYVSPITDFLDTVQIFSPDNFMIGYYSPLTFNELENFFCIEMERMGWKMINKICNIELLLLFKKPHNMHQSKYCYISLRNKNNSQEKQLTTVIISQMLSELNEN